MYLILALLAFGPPQQTTKPVPVPVPVPVPSVTVSDNALLQLAEEDVNIFGHLAAIIASDGDLDACCPNVDAAIAKAFRTAGDENDLFIFTGNGDDEQLRILQQDENGMFSLVFEAYLLEMQFSGAREVTDLVGANAAGDGGDVHCVKIDNNTILCAWSNPNRVIILCRTGNSWKICFDSKRINPR